MSSEDKLPPFTPDETEQDVKHPTTGDAVASVKETTASTDSLKSGSQGLLPYRRNRAPTVPSDPQPLMVAQQHKISCQCVEETTRRGDTMVLVVTTTPLARPSTRLSAAERGNLELLDETSTLQQAPLYMPPPHDIPHESDPYLTGKYHTGIQEAGGRDKVQLSASLPEERQVSKQTSNDDTSSPPPTPPSSPSPTPPSSPPPTPLSLQNENQPSLSGGHSSSDWGEVLSSPPSPPASIPAETTGHSDTMSHQTPNERDQKDMERRDNVQGGIADVVVIENVSTRALAVRKASKSEDYGDGLRECKILSKLNVIIFLRPVREKAPVKFILKFGPYGTVRELFRGKECFQPPARMSYFLKHTIHGMSYLHQHGIIHGAINGDNVAVYLNGQCKLTNFDQAIPVKDVWKEREKKGTWCYSSPELIADPKCSYPADVWSAMLLFVVMMTGEAPWHSSIEKAVSSERCRYLEGTILITSYFEKKHYLKLVNESLYRERLQAEFGNAPEYARQLAIFNELAALARKVLVRDPSQRPSADDLLNSPVMIGASTYIVKT